MNKAGAAETTSEPTWTIEQLRDHLQAAVDLEFWTIPFYMSAMYSIKDSGTQAYQAILSVVNQEMLHVQLAANLANAYGLSPRFACPIYHGQNIPHLDFDLDHPDPREQFSDYSAEIGPFDQARLNAMCLIEYPMWVGTETPCPWPDYTSYGSIGEFYSSVAVGAKQLEDAIAPVNQVNHFARFYNRFQGMNITGEGAAAFPQVNTIVQAICDQGEGRSDTGTSWTAHSVSPQYQNTADDTDPSWSHFQKFMALWSADHFPETYDAVANPAPGSAGAKAQTILEENFKGFLNGLDAMFSGGDPKAFMTQMFALGGNILNCWKNGAVPKFGISFGSLEAAGVTAACSRRTTASPRGRAPSARRNGSSPSPDRQPRPNPRRMSSRRR